MTGIVDDFLSADPGGRELFLGFISVWLILGTNQKRRLWLDVDHGFSSTHSVTAKSEGYLVQLDVDPPWVYKATPGGQSQHP